MGRTQLNRNLLKDFNLTGASFVPDIKIYNELVEYNKGDIVFFSNSFFYATKTISKGAREGDLSNSPINNSAWVETRVVADITNDFKEGDTLSLPYYSNPLLQVYKYKEGKENLTIYPVNIEKVENFNFIRQFASPIKLNNPVKYNTNYENDLYFAFDLDTNNYETIDYITGAL